MAKKKIKDGKSGEIIKGKCGLNKTKTHQAEMEGDALGAK